MQACTPLLETESPSQVLRLILLLFLVVVSRLSEGKEVIWFQALTSPRGVALDDIGNVYIADTANNRIVKLNSTGSQLDVFTVANTLSSPSGVALDSFGNIYIADSGNNRIVKLSSSGSQLNDFRTTGPGLRNPFGVAVDISGNMYIDDGNNRRIVVLNPMGSQITSFNPSTTTFWKSGCGVALDASSNIYLALTVANPYRGTIVIHDSSGHRLNSFVTPPFYGSCGIALDNSGHLYMINTGMDHLVKLNSSTGAIIDIFNVSTPSSNNFSSIAVDGSGNLYISDSVGDHVTKLNSTGSELAEFTCRSFSNPRSIALDRYGNLYVTDIERGHIVKLSSAGNVLAIFPAEDQSMRYYSVALDASDNIYIAGVYDNNVMVLILDPMGILLGSFSTIQTIPSKLAWISIAVHSPDNIYVSEFTTFIQLNSTSGDYREFTHKTHGFGPLHGIATDVSGNIYLADSSNKRVLKLSPSGSQLANFTTSFPTAVPTGIALDGDGNIYVSDNNDDYKRVIKLNSSGSEMATFTTADPSLNLPLSVAVDDDGHIYVPDASNNRIVVFRNNSEPFSSSSTGGSSQPNNSNIFFSSWSIGYKILFIISVIVIPLLLIVTIYCWIVNQRVATRGDLRVEVLVPLQNAYQQLAEDHQEVVAHTDNVIQAYLDLRNSRNSLPVVEQLDANLYCQP